MIELGDTASSLRVFIIRKIVEYFVCANCRPKLDAHGYDLSAGANHDRTVTRFQGLDGPVQVRVPWGEFVEENDARLDTLDALAGSHRIRTPISETPRRKAYVPTVTAGSALHFGQIAVKVYNVRRSGSLVEIVDIGCHERCVVSPLPVRDHQMGSVRLHCGKFGSSRIVERVYCLEIVCPCGVIAYVFDAVVVPQTAGIAKCGNTAISGCAGPCEDEEFRHASLHQCISFAWAEYPLRLESLIDAAVFQVRLVITPSAIWHAFKSRSLNVGLPGTKRFRPCSHHAASAAGYERGGDTSVSHVEAVLWISDFALYAEADGIGGSALCCLFSFECSQKRLGVA